MTYARSASGKSIPTMSLVRTWPIVVTFLYFANGGTFNTSADGSSKSSTAHKIGLLIVCVVAIVLFLQRYRSVLTAVLRLPWLMLFAALGMISCAWSVDPLQSLVSGVTLVCFMLLAVEVSDLYDADGVLDLIMLTGVIAVPLSLLVSVLVPSIGSTSSGWRGIFSHKQQCAAVGTILLVTAIHWLPRSQLQRVLRGPYILLCIVMIGMSGSRTGWLLAAIALFLSAALWVLQKARPKDALLIALGSIPVAAIVFYVLTLASTFLLAKLGKDATLNQRTIIWDAAWQEVKRRPWLGYGYESFWRGISGSSVNVVLTAGWDVYQAQSGYLDLLLQFGVLGPIVLVLILLKAVGDVIRSFRSKLQPHFVRWCMVVILCNLIYNIGESDFGYLKMLWMIFVLAVIGLAKQAALATTVPAMERGEVLALKPRVFNPGSARPANI